MRNVITVCLIFLAGVPSLIAKVIVFSQDGFPTVASQPISREALIKAMGGMNPVFLNIDGLKPQSALELNDNVGAIGDVYRYAAQQAGVPAYGTAIEDPGILICPS